MIREVVCWCGFIPQASSLFHAIHIPSFSILIYHCPAETWLSESRQHIIKSTVFKGGGGVVYLTSWQEGSSGEGRRDGDANGTGALGRRVQDAVN